ncbi:hypothetical protein RS130_13585 [Paraglaciecola aquimarina]|uniref:Solute-binding protein family 3/N-terminal domain-containing protein n=1 Tax=Paraglaciecola aquimarina TaxID=1235557 RepID=A0ABU3SXV3_9ALTE|nr:hypothetical protein [Paraglaciecola aquimarina]MDU0354812.1 hypothetical protein [Paraglaciecola aquimarina]
MFDENNLLDLAAYKAIQESGLDAPFAHISYRYLKQQNVLTPIHTTVDIGLRLVTQGRLDGYVVEQKVAAELVANSEYSEQLTITSGLLMHTYVFSPVNLAFFDKNKKQVTAFWQALHEAALQINK